MKSRKKMLLKSALAMLLCISMLVGSTFAWFTDTVKNSGNIIQSGNLDLQMYWAEDPVNGPWYNVEEDAYNTIFSYDNWEPGYTEYKYIKLVNAGNLALNYDLAIEAQGTVGKLAEVINVFFGEGAIALADRSDLDQLSCVGLLNNVMNGSVTAGGTLLAAQQQSPLHPSGEVIMTVAMTMITTAGNEYQGQASGDFTVRALATQASFESDSFGSDYDASAELPTVLRPGSVSAPVTPVDGKVPTGGVNMVGEGLSAFVPEGTVLVDGADKLTLTVTPMEDTTSGIVAVNDEILIPVDVHIEGVAEGNTVPIVIDLGAVLPKYLNIGNYHLIHVENGVNNGMTLVADRDQLTAHNTFTYDPATGEVSVAMASFSELTLVAEPAAWEGGVDHSWYVGKSSPYTITNADQLWSFSQIVGGMAKDENGNFLITYTDSDGDAHHNDTFSDKTVTLVSNINLGDDEKNNVEGKIFYPIGYWNSEGTYEKTGTAISSGFYTFQGTFDGNGNTISNFYQNTWEMKGDHDWYDTTDQYYRDGMGLFGRVSGGTVKNLTVSNFSCDSEIGTSGVIAAYADSKNEKPALFENITINDCNPRVYNIGNGGIVGCAGWYSRNDSLGNDGYANAVTFRNISVDQTNRISALWGSWGVSCAGILGQYYPDSSCGIKMENCHVAAIIDVNNDVCSNYQYYWYRYAGMFIGTIRANTKDANGNTVADTTGVFAENCTYTMGNWNEYWYCEIVANSLASYTHDHQFSRLTNISSLSEIQDESGNWTKEGHFALLNEDRAITDCYHIFKNSSGNLYRHFHDAADESNPNIYETFDLNGDGELNDLKEDRQRYFIPFNQLLTGLDMGIKAHTQFDGITFVENGTTKSVEKFTATNKTEIDENEEVSVGALFTASGKGSISSPTVQVYVSPVGYGSTVNATYSANSADWDEGTLAFKGTGSAKVVITDYFYCTSTTIYVTVGGVVTGFEKFDIKLNNGDFLHRVGNLNAVTLGSLFKAKEGTEINAAEVTIEAVDSTGVSGTYTSNTLWTDGTIQFSGTGVVKVTITDGAYCTPTVLNLEVVDARNATTAMNTYEKDANGNISARFNVVLLKDISASSIDVAEGYTFYGNGFELNYAENGQYLNNGLKQGVVMVQNGGVLDNLRVKASIYPAAYLYYGATQLGEYVQDGPYSQDGDKKRYHYQLSAVATYGDATISNCYIYGGRTNVYVNTGNVTIEDSVLECGTAANVQIQSTSAYKVTLNNITTIQYQTNATIADTSKVMLGAGVLVGPDTETNPKIVLNGAFKQYNWVTAEDEAAVSGEVAKKIINGAVNATEFNHTINGKTASNLGIIYMNEADIDVTNNTGLPYKEGEVSISSAKGKVYSLQGANSNQIYSEYASANKTTVNGDYVPKFVFDLGDQAISYDGSEDTRYLYGDAKGVTALYQDGDAALTLDLSKLATISKYTGQSYEYTAVCKNSSGNALSATNNVITLQNDGQYTLEFTIQDTIFYDKDGQTITKTVERTYTVPVTLTVKEANIKNAEVKITKTALDGVYTTVNLTDYKLRINFLDCISVTDYDKSGNGTTVNLSSNIASAVLTPASVNVFTTASTITITYTDGRVLTVNLSKISGSSPGTKTAILNTSGGLYFITDGALNNKPTEASSQNKCTITSVSFKGNSGSAVTNDTDVTVTWALGSSSGCFAEGTLITLADGTRKPIEQVTYADELLAWDFNTGKYATTVPSLIESHEIGEYRVINLKFADGTVTRVLVDHGFFDVEENNFVFIDEESVDSYVGHEFVKVDGDGRYENVELVGYEITVEKVSYYTIQTAIYNNCIAEGMFTLTSPPEMLDNDDWFNYFEIGEGMKYDEEKMQADIEKYGLYTYEDFAEYVTYEQFLAFNGPYLKVLVGRGIVTYEQIIELIATYVN